MNIDRAELELVNRVKAFITTGGWTFSCDRLPESDSQYARAQSDRCVVYIGYAKSETPGHDTTDAASQHETLTFEVVIIGRKLRGDGGVLDTLAKVKLALKSFRGTDLDKVWYGGGGFHQRVEDQIWHSHEFKARGVIVEWMAESNDPILEEITFHSQFGQTVVPDEPVNAGLYVNDADSPTFSLEVPAGSTVAAPKITVTEVDGTEQQRNANEDITCAFIEIEVFDTSGTLIETVTEYPEDGRITVPAGGADATFELNSTEVGTAPSGGTLNVQVLQGGSPVGSLVGSDWVIPECPAPEDAVYSNGGDFTVDIPSGDTYTAPQITVTDVDGSTRPSLPNIGVVCEWKVLQGVDSEGNTIRDIVLDSYPTGGEFEIPDCFINSDTNQFTLPYRSRVDVLNANISAAVNDTPIGDSHNLTVEVDVPVVNSNGDTVGSNVDDLLNPHPLPDLPVTDNNGAVGSYPMPTSIVVSGQVNTASYSGGVLTIDPQGGGSPTAICPAPIFATQANLFGETGFVEGAQIAAGVFDPPTGAFAHLQGLDYTAAIPFVTLKHSHLASTARWRDSSNNPLAYGDATVADGLVRDYNFDREWYVVRATVANFQAALDYAAAATFGGHSDWRLPIRAELWTLFDLDNTNNISTFNGRPPGFDTNSTNSVVSCTTAELGSTFVYATFGTNRRTQFISKTSSVNVILVRNMNSY